MCQNGGGGGGGGGEVKEAPVKKREAPEPRPVDRGAESIGPAGVPGSRDHRKDRGGSEGAARSGSAMRYRVVAPSLSSYWNDLLWPKRRSAMRSAR